MTNRRGKTMTCEARRRQAEREGRRGQTKRGDEKLSEAGRDAEARRITKRHGNVREEEWKAEKRP